MTGQTRVKSGALKDPHPMQQTVSCSDLTLRY